MSCGHGRAIVIAALAVVVALLTAAPAAHALLGAAGTFGAAGTGNGQFNTPQRIAINTDATPDQILVVDSLNDRVQVFSDSGAGNAPGSITHVGNFGVGQLNDPVGIAVNQALDYIYVTDAGNNRIVRWDVGDLATFDPSALGAPDESFGTVDTAADCTTGGTFETLAVGIAVDPASNNLLIPDRAGCVHRLDADGLSIALPLTTPSGFGGLPFRHPPNATTDVLGPRDIAVEPAGGSYWVAESGPSFATPGRAQKVSSLGAFVGSLNFGTGLHQGIVGVDPGNSDVLAATAVGGFSVDHSLQRFLAAGGAVQETFGTAASPIRNGIAVADALDRVYVSQANTSQILVFATLQPPATTTQPESNVEWTTATLNATVNPNGAATTCQFQYLTETAYQANPPANRFNGAQTAACTPSPGSVSTPVNVSANVSGLTPGTQYRYRVTATNAAGTTNGADEPLETLALSNPDAEITNVEFGAHTATFTGTVNPQGPVTPPSPNTSYRFEYRRATDSDWQRVPASDVNVGNGTTAMTVEHSVDELWANTDYEVRLIATKASGAGSDTDTDTFKTTAKPPDVTATGATAGVTGAELRGQVRTHNAATSYHFEYGTTTAYGDTAGAGTAPAAGDPRTSGAAYGFATQIGGLQADTTYHLRVVATNASGTTFGPDRTFVTGDGQPGEPAPDLDGERGYELVSRSDDLQYTVGLPGSASGTTAASHQAQNSTADGDHVVYTLGAGAVFDGLAPDGEITDLAVASRDADGWQTRVPLGDRSGVGCPFEGHGTALETLTADGRKLAWMTSCRLDKERFSDGLDLADGASHPFIADVATDGVSFLWNRFGVPGTLPVTGTLVQSLSSSGIIGGTPDLSTVYFHTNAGLLPGVGTPGSGDAVYRRTDDGVPELLTRNADGKPFGINASGPAGVDPVPFSYPGAVSDDGGSINLSIPGNANTSFNGALDVRDINTVDDVYQIRGNDVTWISDPGAVASGNRPPPQTPSNRSFHAASGDGSLVYFATAERMTADDTDTELDIYVYDFDRPPNSRISRVSMKDAACGACDDNVSNAVGQTHSQAKVAAVSGDGSHLFFVTGDTLTAEDVDAQQSLYVHRYGANTTYVAPAGAAVTSATNGSDAGTATNGSLVQAGDRRHSGRPIRVSDDGGVAFFSLATNVSLPAGRGGIDGDNARDLFVWRDEGAGWQQRLRRIRQGVGPDANTAAVPAFACHGRSSAVNHKPACRGMTTNGELVFFNSSDPLVDADDNQMSDAYAIHTADGRPEMIAPVTDVPLSRIGSEPTPGEAASEYVDNSADGSDVFFLTRLTLDPTRDRDGDDDGVAGYTDLYNARLGGVFPPLEKDGECDVGTNCQGSAPPVPAAAAVGSDRVGPVDDAPLRPRARLAVAGPKLAARRRAGRRGVLALRVRATEAGRVRALARARMGKRMRRVARGSVAVRPGAAAVVRLRLTAAATRSMRRGRPLVLRIRVTLGGARARTLTVRLPGAKR